MKKLPLILLMVILCSNMELVGGQSSAPAQPTQDSSVWQKAGQPSTAAANSDNLEGLPLIELPGRKNSDLLAVIVTGDGGWAAIDRSIGERFVDLGISVVGLNSLKYFWNLKTPEQSAHDLERILRHYLATWDKTKVVLIGYSQGADVLPFMTSRLPSDIQNRVEGLALLGLAREASFEITVSRWLEGAEKAVVNIEPELHKLSRFPILCIYGSTEKDTLCLSKVPIPQWQRIEIPGGHHFDGDFKKLADLIISRLRLVTAR